VSRIAPFLARSIANARDMGRRRGLQWVMLVGVAAVFASAAAVYEIERTKGGPIDDFGTALWWAMSTITTVGYGDATPVSPAGRGVAVLLMIIGITFFSWVTASIAAFLVESANDEVTVTTSDLMRKMEALEQEIRALRQAPPNS
jgi:voltage-gated potassium channel